MFTAAKKMKKHLIWIMGKPDSGKSSFIRRVRKIFGADEVDWRGIYLPVRKRSNPTIKTQVVTCEEFNYVNALNQEGRQTCKLLFEGEGAPIRSGLYK